MKLKDTSFTGLIIFNRKLDKKAAAEAALSCHLYIEGFGLKKYLERMVKYDMDNGTKICMCFDKGTPVAICLTDKGNEIETFVKEEYRRRGIGTKMVKQLSHPETKYNSGLDGSVEFYKSLGLRPSAVEQAYQNELRYKS